MRLLVIVYWIAADMQHIRTVKAERANKLALEHGVAEISIVSAQSGEAVHALFRKITATVLGLRLGRADFEQDIVAADVIQNKVLIEGISSF